MTRIKADKVPLITIIDWSAADHLVKELGELQNSITSAEGFADKEINAIKEKLESQVNQLQDRQKYIVKSLEAFANDHTKDFGEARSRKLDFGILGWRFSTAIEIAGATLEWIKVKFSTAKQKMCIRVKESVDKEAMAKLTDEELATVKARRKTKDAFFVEPILIEAKEH